MAAQQLAQQQQAMQLQVMHNSHGLNPHASPWIQNYMNAPQLVQSVQPVQPTQSPQLTSAPVIDSDHEGPFGSTLVVPTHGGSSNFTWNESEAPEVVEKSLRTLPRGSLAEMMQNFQPHSDVVGQTNKYKDMIRVMGHGSHGQSVHYGSSNLYQLVSLEVQLQQILAQMKQLESG